MSSLIQPGSAVQVRRQFLKSQDEFDAHSAVFESVAQQLQERLGLLAIQPSRVLDLGCRTGYQLDALQEIYPDAQIVGCDLATRKPVALPRSWPDWLRKRPRSPERLICDPHELPFAPATFDLVVSNLLLPWSHSPHRVFEEAERILRPGGAFMFTTAGPDTLMEYRSAWAKIDSYMHSFGLIDMHDIGDSMMAAGFAAPVLDRDVLRVDYPSIRALQKELLSLGAANVASGRRLGLMAPGVIELLDSESADKGRFVVSLELVHGHGWKGELHLSGKNTDSEYKIPVDSLRGSWSNKMPR
jgi:malonyl-CoA O-methyltransferase